MYILDNNILNILFYPSPARQLVVGKIAEKGKHNVWLSVITVYEKIFNGIIPVLSKSLNKPEEVTHFGTMVVLMEKISEFQILPFTETDYSEFKKIYNAVGKAALDCRLAASAKTRNWTVVTHDSKDFSRIKAKSGVEYEDWSVTPFS